MVIMKSHNVFFLFIASLVMLPGCWGEKSGKKASEAAAPSLTKLRVVNVLEKNFYDDAHIIGSINIPLIKLKKEAESWDKDVPVVVYCSNYRCSASVAGAKMLKEMGFKDVLAYEGGMAEWFQLGKQDSSFRTTGSAREDYLSIVVPAPEHVEAPQGVTIVSAQQLKNKLTEAGL